MPKSKNTDGCSFFVKEEDMGFRSLLIENELKISLRLGNIVITKDEEDIWLPLTDINIIVVDTPKVTISSRFCVRA